MQLDVPEDQREGFFAALGDGFTILPLDTKDPTLLRFGKGTLSDTLVVRLRAALKRFPSVSTGKQNSSAGACARTLPARRALQPARGLSARRAALQLRGRALGDGN